VTDFIAFLFSWEGGCAGYALTALALGFLLPEPEDDGRFGA